jgi:hypothetical protein
MQFEDGKDSAKAEIVQANPAGLVGKDVLGFSALTAQFKPPRSKDTSEMLLGMTGFESAQQVEGSYVRLSSDDFVVAVHHAGADTVFVLWVAEGETKRFFSKRAGKEIEYRVKELTGFLPAGFGQSGVDEAKAVVSEFRDAVELIVMRDLMGAARAETDADKDASVGDEELDVTYEEELDELRSLMED